MLFRSSLVIDLADHLSGKIAFEVVGFAKYGAVSSSVVKKITLDVAAVESGLDGINEANEAQLLGGAGSEDQEAQLSAAKINDYLSALQAHVIDQDGSEFVGLDLELASGWSARFLAGSSYSAIKVGANTWRVMPADPATLDLQQSVAALKSALSAMRISAPANFAGSGTVQVRAFTAEDAGVNALPSTIATMRDEGSFIVTVSPVADKPTLTAIAEIGRAHV